MKTKLSRQLGLITLAAIAVVATLALATAPSYAYEDSLKAYYKMDESTGSTATDSKGSNNATLTNMENTDWGAGKFGNALSFDGVNEYGTSNSNLGITGSQAHSVVVWSKSVGDSKNGITWSMGGSSGGGGGIVQEHGINEWGTVWCGVLLAGIGDGPGATFDPTVWHLSVFTYDGATQRLYINSNAAVTGNRSYNQPDSQLRIGTWMAPGNYYLYNGQLDDLAVFNRVLTAAEVGYLAGGGGRTVEQLETTLNSFNNAGSADWNTAANWRAGMLPGSIAGGTTAVYIDNGGTATVGSTPANAVSGITLSSATGSGTLTLNAGTLTSNGNITDGGGTSTLNIAGGTLAGTWTTATVDNFSMSSGTLGGTGTLTATTYDLSGGTVTANLGTGTMNVTGSTALNGTSGATAANISAGTLTLGSSDRLANGGTVAVSGTGVLGMGTYNDTVETFNMSAGSINGSGTLTATTYGLSGGTVTANLGTGTMNVTGSTALNGTSGATAVNISAGTLTLGSSNRLADGGTVAVSGSGILSMGSYNDTVSGVQMTGGSITGSGGTLTSTSAFDMQAGSVSAKLGGSVALNKTTSGTVTLTGANAYTGATAVSSGILNIQNDSALGDTASGTSVTSGAALQLQGGRNIGAEALTIRGMGVAGSGGALRSISGNNTYGGLVTLGDISRINSDADTLSLTGGVDNAGYNLYIGGAGNTILSSITGSGILTHDGAGALTVTSITTNALDVTGGSINVSSPSTVGTFTMSGGSVTGAGTITGTSYSLTDSGSISASLGDKVGGGSILTKTGSGTVTISGTNTYTGNTTISEGKLALSGTGSIALSPLINIASGASLDTTGLSGVFTLSSGQTLKGTGTVTGNINMGSGSTIAPGNSPGHQHITESTTWLTGASYDWEINSLTGTMGEDPGWDWIDIGGTLTIQDDYEFHISLLNGVMPVAGASFIAASAGVSISLIGTPIFKDESTGQVITTWSAHVVGNDLKLQYDGSGVPEPATVVGLLIAGLGMIARRRLLRRQQ